MYEFMNTNMVNRVNANRQRLHRYDIKAWIHLYFYRALVIYSLVYALLTALDIVYVKLPEPLIVLTNLVLWVLATPLFIIFVKGFLMVLLRRPIHLMPKSSAGVSRGASYRARFGAHWLMHALIVVWVVIAVLYLVYVI